MELEATPVSENEVKVNAVQLAAVFEALLMGPNHFNFSEAKEMAEGFCAAERASRMKARAAKGRESLGRALKELTDSGMSYSEALVLLNAD